MLKYVKAYPAATATHQGTSTPGYLARLPPHPGGCQEQGQGQSMRKSEDDPYHDAAFLQHILNSLPTGIFFCDKDLVVRYINDAYATYLGVLPEEILGKPITDFIPDSRAPFVTSTGKAEMGDLRVFKDEDGERIIVVNRLPLRYSDQGTGMLSQVLFSSREEFNATQRRIENLDKRLAAYARRIKIALSPDYTLQSIIGTSPAIQELRSCLVRYAQMDSPVLILGATGTGKELAANALHCEGLRKEGPFVSINCAAIPAELFESELFGYAPGAFSGAHKNGKVGQIELADKGTLFLDEIGDIPMPAQAKLLRVLENRTLQRIGSSEQRAVDFCLVSATNSNLKAMIAERAFREDLYYRISPLILNVPTLHERTEDIPLLVAHLLRRMKRENVQVTQSALATLSLYCWPGNVRELRNVVVRALSHCQNNVIDMGDLPPELLTNFGTCSAEEYRQTPTTNLPAMLANNELRLITLTLQEQKWNVSRSAKILGIARATLYEKLKKYGITRENCHRLPHP